MLKLPIGHPDAKDELRFYIDELVAESAQERQPFLDMAANQAALGEQVKRSVADAFGNYGLELDGLGIENISLPEELQKALDTRISMGMAGDLKQYTQYQTAQAIPLAAQNEGGMAGLGAGIASGIAMGQAMTQALAGGALAPATPAASAPAADDPEARLAKLQSMLQKGLISQADYDSAKADILKRLVG